jgi:hypothetical protein
MASACGTRDDRDGPELAKAVDDDIAVSLHFRLVVLVDRRDRDLMAAFREPLGKLLGLALSAADEGREVIADEEDLHEFEVRWRVR